MIMKAKEFAGIIPPMLTAFTQQGEIYEGCKDSSFDFVNFLLYQNAVSAYPWFSGSPMMTSRTSRAAATQLVPLMGYARPGVRIHGFTARFHVSLGALPQIAGGFHLKRA